MRWLALLPCLAGCGEAPPAPTASAGDRLEAAAVAAGLVMPAASAALAGAYARDGDRLCVVPREGDEARIGVAVDYGEGQRCRGRGTVRRSGDKVAVDFGACRFSADFDGERVSFPPELPETCAALCSGRATLTALEVTRLSGSVSEASAMRDGSGRLLCGS